MESVQVEGALLRVPVEELKRLTRAQAKLAERELVALRELAAGNGGEGDADAAALARVAERLRAAAQRVDELAAREREQLDRATARAAHLVACAQEDNAAGANELPVVAEVGMRTGSGSTLGGGALGANALRRVDRMLAEHMHREGCHTAAGELADASNVSELVDGAAFAGAHAALAALQEKGGKGASPPSAAERLGPALAWAAEHRARLKRAGSHLEFELRLQEVAEEAKRAAQLAAAGDAQAAADARASAVKHVRAHLAPWASTHMPKVQCAVGLVALVSAGASVLGGAQMPARYAALLSDERWEDLAGELRRASWKVCGLAEESALATYVRAGLAALADSPPPAKAGGVGARAGTRAGRGAGALAGAGMARRSRLQFGEDLLVPVARRWASAQHAWVPYNELVDGGEDMDLDIIGAGAGVDEAIEATVERLRAGAVGRMRAMNAGASPAEEEGAQATEDAAAGTQAAGAPRPCANADANDPLRSPEVRALAAGLPRAKTLRSTLVCPASGAVMSEDNPPMVLPNGRVYSLQAVQRMADAGGGMVTCPATGETWLYKELRKAYIM